MSANESSALEKDLARVCANFGAIFEAQRQELEKSAANETLNETLALTDELCTLTEIVDADTRVSNGAIEAFSEKCPQIEALFAKIDRLESFVNDIKESVKNLTLVVSKAESELNKK